MDYLSDDSDSTVIYMTEPCCICNKDFTSDTELAAHLINHGNDKWYQEMLWIEQRKSLIEICKPVVKSNGRTNNFTPPAPQMHTLKRKASTSRSVSPEIWEYVPEEVLIIDSEDEGMFSRSLDKSIPERLQAAPQRITPVKKSHSKAYKCIICRLGFDTKSQLKNHMVFHNDNEEFLCYLCKKGFPSRDVLRKHLNKHVGGKEYECVVCSKKFSLKSMLQKHEKSHILEDVPPRQKSKRITRKRGRY